MNVADRWHWIHRCNLSPIQRIAVTEKYRPIYEKQAKENLVKAGNNYGVGKNKKPFQKSENPIIPINTTKKLAKTAGVGTGAVARMMQLWKTTKQNS